MTANDLACYAVALWPRFELAAHHELIVSKLEAVERGDIRRLMMFLPPRHGKSLIGTEIFPAWFLGRNPGRSVIITCYDQELTNDFGRRVRDLVSNPLHGAIFPGCRLGSDSTSRRHCSTTAGGSFYAIGRGGALTGRGAHLLLIDDPLKNAAEAHSEAIRRTLFEWYQAVARTRLNSGGSIVLICTRWHLDDLAGRLLRENQGEPWEILRLPAIAEGDESFRRAGDALWPEKFPLAELEKARKEVGAAYFASLYQQRPAAAQGTIFRREWWRYYREQPAFTLVAQAWDTGFKSGRDNDYSVCTTWGVNVSGYFLLWFWRDRVEFPQLKRVAISLAAEWKPNLILIEDRASGQSLVQELRYASNLPIVPIKIDSDKVARAQAVTPLIESGKVFLPDSVPWLNEFVDELAAFPTGTHDDVVDSTTQALNYLRHRQTNEVRVTTVYL